MVRLLLTCVIALALAWAALLAALVIARPDGATLADVARVLPDLVRLLRRLAGDPAVPLGARVTLWLLAGYLASPIDLVPDFVPLLGYADDAIVAAVALRRVVHRAGSDAIERHWTGSPAGLAVVRLLAGVGTGTGG
jgi:uncharacterized membrane protein YkvA (DUF1232 family)